MVQNTASTKNFLSTVNDSHQLLAVDPPSKNANSLLICSR
jgi:hypothetical protein